MSFGHAQTGRGEKVSHKPQIATFFDWSPALSIQRCHPAATTTAAAGYDLSIPGGGQGTMVRPCPTGNPRYCTGRMFHRERSKPTKGERHIISGIMQNRGDFTTKDKEFHDLVDAQGLLTHNDAWRVGKGEDVRPNSRLSSRAGTAMSFFSTPEENGDLHGYMDVHHQRLRSPRVTPRGGEDRCVTPGTQAPPASPQQSKRQLPISDLRPTSAGRIRLTNINRTIPPIRFRNGGTCVRKVDSDDCVNPGSSRTVVEVYLPRLSLTPEATPIKANIADSNG